MGHRENHFKVLSDRELADKFLIGIILSLLLIFYNSTFELSSEARQVPRLLIYISAIVIFTHIIKEYVIEYFDEYIDKSSVKNNKHTERSEDANFSETKSTQQDPMEFVPVTKQIITIGVYIWSLSSIGFFTTNVVFVFSYIYFRDRSSIISPLLWAAGVNIFVYFLFVHWLRFGAIFRLGYNWII